MKNILVLAKDERLYDIIARVVEKPKKEYVLFPTHSRKAFYDMAGDEEFKFDLVIILNCNIEDKLSFIMKETRKKTDAPFLLITAPQKINFKEERIYMEKRKDVNILLRPFKPEELVITVNAIIDPQ